MNIKLGDKIEHILSKDWLIVIEVRADRYLCRKKDLGLVELYDFEIKPVK